MPFPQTWTEELVAEWLDLRGYLVKVNLPVVTPEEGGRRAPDIVGARINQDTLEIIHVEVGQLSESKDKNIKRIRNKFSEDVCNRVKEYFKQLLNFTSDNVEYYKIYVAKYPKNLADYREEVSKLNIEVKSLKDFIYEDVLPTIRQWKEHPPHVPKTKGKIALPESHWMLYLTDFIFENFIENR
ncbi:MAG: hypothetical protein QW810_07475 [Nitrososphaerota archaeon]